MQEIAPGSIIGGKYEIVKLLGVGGMGAVYLARDRRHEDFHVALKFLSPGILRSVSAKERFRNEIIAAYRVVHSNVVAAYDFFDQDGIFAYAMEYVSGGDLFDYQDKHGNLTPEVVAEILIQICKGLEALHAEGIIHRDLKPENILISEDGVIKIADFGVARVKGRNSITQSGGVVGTPKYLAPEYLETFEFDRKGDIYALGIIGYELLTYSSPFKSEDITGITRERIETKSLDPRKVDPTIPEGIAKIIQNATATNPEARYQSATEMLEDLEKTTNNTSIDYIKKNNKRKSSFSGSIKRIKRVNHLKIILITVFSAIIPLVAYFLINKNNQKIEGIFIASYNETAVIVAIAEETKIGLVSQCTLTKIIDNIITCNKSSYKIIVNAVSANQIEIELTNQDNLTRKIIARKVL